MDKSDFKEFYNKTIAVLGKSYAKKNKGFNFFDNLDGLYEEYMNQKAMIHWIYEKPERLLDRHKICACMTVAIMKVRLIASDLSVDDGYRLTNASCVNEQLAFLSSWELLKGFICAENDDEQSAFVLPETFHNDSFEETITRSLFMANQLNGLSVPLIANIYFLLEVYCTRSAT